MLHTLQNQNWHDTFAHYERQSAISALENGMVIYLPQLSFHLSPAEQTLLSPHVLSAGFKNISYVPKDGSMKGASHPIAPKAMKFAGHNNQAPEAAKFEGHNNPKMDSLKPMLQRFYTHSQTLLHRLIPHYKANLIDGRTSYRPAAVVGRKTSLLKDDTRLHVDAFTATPNQGKRILRVFSNINPNGESRVWHLGEPFAEVVKQFLPKLHKPWPGSRKILELFKITKTYRSLYDHYMLMLHNQMKKDDHYQHTVQKTVVPFPAGSTWIVMTDSVSHAALSGQFLLEQTFYLEPADMQNPNLSPRFILEQALKQDLSLF